MNSWQRVRMALLRWHRRLGAAVAIFVLLLSITGIALNHTSELGLAYRYLRPGWSELMYDVSIPRPSQYLLAEDQRITFVTNGNGHGSYFLNDELLGECFAPLKGAVNAGAGFALLCNQQLVWLTGDGALIDTIDEMFGLPPNSGQIGLPADEAGEKILIKAEGTTFALDLNAVNWQELEVTDTEWSAALEKDIRLSDNIQAQLAEGGISWERIILDLHAGRFMGSMGPYFMDLVALIFMAIALSGIWVWARALWQRSRRS